ncbi:hypothetical protein NDU88_005350 [Pleurodeles waltl]|uniref:Uncharacterized protein n=1 Tax=Pleurodeles waltl TaxID=8319 RepID=A0AAV7MZ06_PLEWA|nr:hypothetical protein NDU88_005350 [Pleurodeles waltl]
MAGALHMKKLAGSLWGWPLPGGEAPISDQATPGPKAVNIGARGGWRPRPSDFKMAGAPGPAGLERSPA